MIFKKALPRRTFLRGMGAALALPYLDSMIPAFASAAEIASVDAKRLFFITVPNGIIMDKWTPSGEGPDLQLSPTLEPLAPFKNRMAVISGLANNEAHKLEGEIAGEHPRACGAYLTGSHVKMTSGADIHVGISVDQVAAKELGKKTQLPSLEIGLEPSDAVGACGGNYSCVYYNTNVWSSATTPLPMESRPRAVFERLFGDNDTTDPKKRAARMDENRSILDFVSEDASDLRGEVGEKDRAKLDQYMDAIRSVERRIQMAEKQSTVELPPFQKPIGVPDLFSDYAKLMFDLQVLAFQSDITRVSTFMVGHEMSGRAYPELGFSDTHHSLTHHQGDQQKIAKVAVVNVFHTKLFAYFLDKMQSTSEGTDGSLLDHTLMLYGSALSDGNNHLYTDLPVLLVGGGIGQMSGARHINFPKEKAAPIANLYISMLRKAGVEMDRFGDSDAALDLPA